jgi:ankyrin repeat protein
MISTKLAKHTPLMNAVKFGDFSMVKLLLSKGADPNARAGDGESILVAAIVWRNDSNVVKLLIERGADLSNQQEREFVTNLKPAYEMYFQSNSFPLRHN